MAPVLEAAEGKSLAAAEGESHASPENDGGDSSAPHSAPPAPPRLPDQTRMTLVTGGVLIGSAFSALDVRGHDHQAFHFAEERFFGKDTYAGGADKVSHLVFYNGLSRELGVAYSRMGYDRDQALLLGAGVALAGGLLVEVGDAVNRSGFSWEDLLVDSFGSGAAAAITHFELDDLLGFRFGPIAAKEPPSCCTGGGGKDYSEELYTGDLKLAGAARRLHLRPGLGRFLLVSMTYGSKGYRHSEVEFRQRVIGAEVGLNFPQILTEVGVRDTTWWGRALLVFFNFVRVPYTQVGFHVDINHKKVYGPDFGQQKFDPGS